MFFRKIFMDTICYINGKYLPKDKLFLGADDVGFTRGYAAYEFIRTYHRVPFYLKEHMERMKRTTAELLLPDPTAAIPQILDKLIEKNPDSELNFRIYVTGTPTLFVIVDLPHPPTEEQYRNGIRVMTTPLSRTVPGAKSTNYTATMIALKQAEKRGFDDALFVDDKNQLLEMSRANFFAIQGNRLYTAKDQVLYGITRNIVLKLAKQHVMRTIEGPIPYAQILEFDEAFLTATSKEILNITQIDNTPIPRGKKADELLALFRSQIPAPPVAAVL